MLPQDTAQRVRRLDHERLSEPAGLHALAAAVEEHDEVREELDRRLAERTAELAHANKLLQEREELYRTVVENAPAGLLVADLEQRITIVNRCAVSLLGAESPETMIGKHPRSLLTAESAAKLESAWNEVRLEGSTRSFECEIHRQDGTHVIADVLVFAVRGRDLQSHHLLAAICDVTLCKQLEEQFRQAQKMEGVGRLAGGVAHDFNNLLTVIKGYTELVLNSLAPTEIAYKRVTQIAKAADKAAALAGQLLAFSRSQVVEPRSLDVNHAVVDLEKMLRRLLGEHIRLSSTLDPDAGSILIDPTEFDQTIINLVVNARDAITTQGAIAIRTRRVCAADSGAGNVCVSVTDNGSGMTDEVKSKIFEPFFTTKESGKGTGLGLSTVHGIVQRAGGNIAVNTVPGAGTTVELQFKPA